MSAFRRRREGLHWCAPEWNRFESVDEFWESTLTFARRKTRLYIFAHNGGFDLPVVKAFSQLPRHGYKLRKAIVDNPPIILEWKSDSHTIKFIDTMNIWKLSVEQIGAKLGLDKLDMPGPDATREEWDTYCRRDVEVIMRAVLEWFQFIRTNDLGGFSPTLASQSFNAFRHRFMKVPIYIDDKVEAIDLARDAFFGGRTECFRLGTYEGDFYHLDINSMYPWIMKKYAYPTKLIGMYKRCTLAELDKWLDKYCIVAKVQLKTSEPVYPVMHDKKLMFPTGRLELVLTSGELKHALERGHIKKLLIVVLYQKARPFVEFVDFVWDTRQEAKRQGNDVDYWHFKIFGNSLFGKWGQRGRVYDTLQVDVDDDIRVWTDIDAHTKEITHYRQFGGLLQHFKDEGESFNSHPAIAAHITGYARIELWKLIIKAKRQNVYYSDTDCLVVNRAGLALLRDNIDATRLGALKIEAEYPRLEIHGPKDYRFGNVQRTKGVRKSAAWVEPDEIIQDMFVGFKGLLQRGRLDAPIVLKISKTLKRDYNKGVRLKSGRVRPLRFNHW